MKRKILAASCDIDATLVGAYSKELSDANRKAIEDLMDAGVKVGLASGRAYEDLKTYPENWGMKRPFDFYIGLNGASLYDDTMKVNSIFFEIEIPHIKMIIEEIDRLDLDCHIYVDGITLFSKASDRFLQIKNTKHRDFKIAKDLSEMYAKKTSKILINCGDERMPEIREHFKPILEATGNAVKLVRTSPGCMEFVPAKANKFYALEKYCQAHDIDINDVAAFGDTTNDNEMIEGAGLGVCMCNGSDDTKALADEISEYPAGEDGFAKYIYQHIL